MASSCSLDAYAIFLNQINPRSGVVANLNQVPADAWRRLPHVVDLCGQRGLAAATETPSHSMRLQEPGVVAKLSHRAADVRPLLTRGVPHACGHEPPNWLRVSGLRLVAVHVWRLWAHDLSNALATRLQKHSIRIGTTAGSDLAAYAQVTPNVCRLLASGLAPAPGPEWLRP